MVFLELRTSSIPVVHARTGIICYLPTYSGSNSGLKHTQKATYLPGGGVNRDRSRRAKPDDMIGSGTS